eukprot:TRINITY_DN1619_c0_g1_i1.p1 TRINITY_DN1619_c0_g1~~TRINITY_DN1619_c0_g1_i1.p1  ORF type:complete len:404 (-),score=70.26 TRINITY_DN1619_c0_g1_i1:349-1560(-)
MQSSSNATLTLCTTGNTKFTSRDVQSSCTSQSIFSVSTKTSRSSSSNANAESQIISSSSLRAFSFNELKGATRNFRADCLLGEGGFGSVFKGVIDEQGPNGSARGVGMVVAVKRLNQGSMQGHKEWLAEVNFLGQFYHPNLVKLMGYCIEDDHRLLVYEYMPRGSLENHLFRKGSYHQPLSWAVRIKIAHGAAKGLAFLHSAENPVIYRDFKASNVLLDSHYNAKLSDFGLAKDGPTGDKTHVTTRVMGTHGYAAPEYIETGHLSAKSDVYSFGVVLLEMLSGRRAVDKNRAVGEKNLIEWAKPYINDKKKIFRIIDTRLEGQYSKKSAQKAAILAFQCLCTDAKLRPDMNAVVELLEELQNDNRDAQKGTHNSEFGKNHSVADANRNTREQDKPSYFSAPYS